MCRRHGIDFNFLGCIMVRTMWEEQRQKELMANRAAFMATTLGAEVTLLSSESVSRRNIKQHGSLFGRHGQPE